MGRWFLREGTGQGPKPYNWWWWIAGDQVSITHGRYDQGANFDDVSSFFPWEMDNAIQYINLGYGAQAPKVVMLYCIFSSFCVVFKF